MMIWGILGCLFVGWLAGGIVNWAADSLPQYRAQAAGAWKAPFVIQHYTSLLWHVPRRGVCPHCGAPVPTRHPVVEGASSLLFLLIWYSFRDNLPLVGVIWLYAAFLLAVLVIDLEHRRVLNVMLAPGAVAALALSLLPVTPSPWQALLGGLVGFGIFLLIGLLGRGALGAGDVKLAGLIGLMTGYPNVIPALVLGIVLGGAAALALLISRRASRKSTMAYAPYLAVGAFLILWGSFGA